MPGALGGAADAASTFSPLGLVAPAVQLGLGLSQGGQTNPAQFSYGGNPRAYIPTAQPWADQQYQNILQNWMGQYNAGTTPPQGNFQPMEDQAFNIAYNQYAPLSQMAANTIAPYMVDLSNQATSNAAAFSQLPGVMYGLGQSAMTGIAPLQQGAQQLLQTGYDPQNALYNQLSNQTLQNAQAANAAAGLGASPYGAGLTSQAMNNFGMNWENQQLGRQAQALRGAGEGYGQAANLGQSAAGRFGQVLPSAAQILGLGTEAVQAGQWGMNQPYATSVGQSQAALPAIQAATNLGMQQYLLPQLMLNDLQSYLGLGQAASGLGAQLGQAGFGQNQQQFGGIGSMLGQIGNAFGNNPFPGLFGGGGGNAPFIDASGTGVGGYGSLTPSGDFTSGGAFIPVGGQTNYQGPDWAQWA